MKNKHLLATIVISIFSTLCFAQNIRAGAFGAYEVCAGTLHDYISSSMGGGVSAEAGYTIPLLFNLEGGPALHAAFNTNPVNDDSLESMKSLKLDAGFFVRLPAFIEGLIFSPEVDYGVLIYFPKTKEGYKNSSEVNSVYTDQFFQLGLGLRYSNPSILNNKLEFELTPTYLFSPEKEASVHFAGLRLGVQYRILEN